MSYEQKGGLMQGTITIRLPEKLQRDMDRVVKAEKNVEE